MKYKITDNILNLVYEFSRLHTFLCAQDMDSVWFKKLEETIGTRAALAAVSIDSAMQLDLLLQQTRELRVHNSLKADFKRYKHLKDMLVKIFKDDYDINLDLIEKLHSILLGIEYKEKQYTFRKTSKTVSRITNENGVYKRVTYKIKTEPVAILKKLNDLIKWFNENKLVVNPIILTGIVHLKMLEIHPYNEGTGRLARLLIHGILHTYGIDVYNVIPIEEYYLKYRDRYYEIIDEAATTQNYTKWLEFFCESLLYSVNEAIDELTKISGGSINLKSNSVVHLTPKEAEIVSTLTESGQLSGAEIAKQLEVSRQHINTILKKLEAKKLVKKIGKGTKCRYELLNK